MDAIFVYITAGSPEEAHRIGSTLVEERLAACANLLGGMTSIYRWQGAVETADEVPAILKSTLAQADALIARIAALHSYDVPCIAVWPIGKLHSDYGDWVEDSVG